MPHSTLRYGPHRSQVAELWRPATPGGHVPVVVLIHGGFWRAYYTKILMHRLASSVVAHGWAAYNIEYRRLGRLGGGGGWPTTFADVSAAIDHLATIDGIDRLRVVTCGHSAGGLLALWAGAHDHDAPSVTPGPAKVTVRGCVSLAGVADLHRAASLGLGRGAAERLVGGDPGRHPGRYAAVSPIEMLPLGIPQVLVHGADDRTVPLSMSEDYRRAAVAAGDDVVLLPIDGLDHRQLLDPAGAGWAGALAHLPRLLDAGL